MTGPVTVTQADREAAAEFSATVARCSMKEPQIADCLAGKQDNALIVQAFARHRLAAEERGAKMALEAAAKVADEGHAHWRDKSGRTANKRESRDYETMAIACVHVSAAIRQIDPAALGAE